MVWVYHAARVILGFGLLTTVYRFLAVLTGRLAVRRLAWLLVAFSGGLGWLLVALRQSNWLGSTPLDFILPEGFTFLVLYAFPHIALARTLLLWGVLSLLRAWHPPGCSLEPGRLYHSNGSSRAERRTNFAWAILAGLLWLLMGLIVPFYVAVAWAVMGAAWVVLGLREGQILWRAGLATGLSGLISAPVAAYSVWVFTTERVYGVWAAQNLILSPHPLHYLAAFGVPLVLALFAAREAWRGPGVGWLALAWVGVVPLLVYLPFNLQRRLVEGVQVPLSGLAALGISRLKCGRLDSRLAAGVLLVVLSLTNGMLIAGNSLALRGRPGPIYRDAAEVTALDWLSGQVRSEDVVLAAYETGNYLPARVGARSFVGHGPESIRADEKRQLVTRFFDATTSDSWRRELLAEHGVDYVFWGPVERRLGTFDPRSASYLRLAYEVRGYALLEVGG
jgi:hypothetical protein